MDEVSAPFLALRLALELTWSTPIETAMTLIQTKSKLYKRCDNVNTSSETTVFLHPQGDLKGMR